MSEAAPRPALQSLPEGIVNLTDFEAHAQARMTPSAWAYLNGGAADEQVLRANRAAWDAIKLWPRVLRDLSGGHTRCTLLGRSWSTPLMLAPIAYQRLAHPDGELASAYAAAAQGAGMILSAQASVPMEAVARALREDPAGGGPLWFQLYWRDDRGFMAELLQRVEAAGFEALVLTVDAPVHGARDRERRAGFQLPEDVRAVNLGGRKKPLELVPGQSAMFDGLMPRAATWAEIDWLRAHSRLPLLLKGLAHPADAREAQRRGVAGLVVSNHGGAPSMRCRPRPSCCPCCVPRSAPGCPCWWMGASVAAPMCSRPCAWAPMRCCWAGPMCMPWPRLGRSAWPRPCVCCAMNSRLRWRSPAAGKWPRPGRNGCGHRASDAGPRQRAHSRPSFGAFLPSESLLNAIGAQYHSLR